MVVGIASVVVGVLLVIAGRRLFWLFVGVAGFLAGMNFATQFLPDNPGMALFISIAVGLIGGLLSIFLQRALVLIAGFLAGGYLAITLLSLFFSSTGGSNSLPFVIGGVLGAILAAVVFDWGLVLLSSLVGAVLVAQYFNPGQPFTTVIIAALFILGIIFQARNKMNI